MGVRGTDNIWTAHHVENAGGSANVLHRYSRHRITPPLFSRVRVPIAAVSFPALFSLVAYLVLTREVYSVGKREGVQQQQRGTALPVQHSAVAVQGLAVYIHKNTCQLLHHLYTSTNT